MRVAGATSMNSSKLSASEMLSCCMISTGLPVAPQNVMPLIGDHDGCGTDIENLHQNEALEYPLQGGLHLLDQALQLFDLDRCKGVPEAVLQIEDPQNPVEQADGNAQFGPDLLCNLDISLRLPSLLSSRSLRMTQSPRR